MLNFLLENSSWIVPIASGLVITTIAWKIAKLSLKFLIPIGIVWVLVCYGFMSSETIDLFLSKLY